MDEQGGISRQRLELDVDLGRALKGGGDIVKVIYVRAAHYKGLAHVDHSRGRKAGALLRFTRK